MKEVFAQVLLAAIGLSVGGVTAGGVFALITVIGILPRMAGHTRTAAHVQWYETAICAGGILGNLVSIYQLPVGGGAPFLAVSGLFSGIFVGCLVMSLAETLELFPLILRRTHLRTGISYIILSFGIGKGLGALLYFWMNR